MSSNRPLLKLIRFAPREYEAAAVEEISGFGGYPIVAFSEFKYFTGVTKIAGGAFENCSSSYKIILPENVSEIGDSAFEGCSCLVSIILPEGVVSIRRAAFYNCSNTCIYCKATTPPAVSSYNTGDESFRCKVIYVPRNSYEEYVGYSKGKPSPFYPDVSNWYYFESYVQPYDFE